jgi:hypothetical protein
MLGTVFFSALIASEGVFTCTANITGYHAVPAQLQTGVLASQTSSYTRSS